MSENTNSRTLTHTGSQVGDGNTTLSQNTPNTPSPVTEWTIPRKYESIHVRGARHQSRATLRTKQTATMSDDDGSAALEAGERTIALNGDISPVAGETKIADQPFPSAVVYNVTQAVEIQPADFSINYTRDEITISDSAVAIGDDVAVWHVMTDGTVTLHALDQFDHDRGAAEEWGVPLHVFADFDSYRQDTQIHLPGHIDLDEYETLAVYIDAPQQVVWQDADYPQGSYVSTVQQGANVELK